MNILDKLWQGPPKGHNVCIEFGNGRINRFIEELTYQNKFNIVVFPKVKNYHTVKLKDLLTEGKTIGSCIVEVADRDKQEFHVNSIGSLSEINGPIPIGFANEELGIMMLFPKAEIAIDGNEAVIKWHNVKRRRKLSEIMFIPLVVQKA